METVNHNWRQDWFEPAGNYHGVTTCIQHYHCRACKEKLALPENQRPHEHGCSGYVQEIKSPWRSPMKERRGENVEKRDYPKKAQKQRKGRA